MSLAKFRKIFKGNDEITYPNPPKPPQPTQEEEPKDQPEEQPKTD